MRLRISCLLLTLATQSVLAATGSRPIPISFTVTSQHLLIIPVALGNGPTHPFLLDTGGGIDVLPMATIRDLHGSPAGEFTGFRLTGERMDLPLFIIPTIRLGPVVEDHALVAGWNGLDQFHIAGVLSLSFFRQHPFTLDMRTHRLLLESAASLRARRANGNVLPVRFDDLRGVSLDLFAPFLLDGHKALCELDTGSQGYIFALRYMVKLGLKPDSPGVKTQEATSILGHREERYVAPVPSLRLVGTELSAPGKSSALFEDLIYDCDVGIDFFENRVVTFDLAHRQLIISGH